MRTMMRDGPALVGGGTLLFAVFIIATVFPYHPRLAPTELTSLADQPALPLSLEPAPAKPALSLPKAQSLMYIVPKHQEKMGDYFDFLNACKAACGSPSVAKTKCSADELGPIYIDYITKCKADEHECACEITYMYCG
jgi:hypothetical protein